MFFLQIVVFLVMICAFCSIACLFWETSTGKRFQMYLPWSFVIPTDQLSGAIIVSLLVFFSYAIVLNTVVPISLYVRWASQLKSSLVKYSVENLLKYGSLYYFEPMYRTSTFPVYKVVLNVIVLFLTVLKYIFPNKYYC